MKDRANQLREAQRTKTLVQFSRPFERYTFYGYILGVGPHFILFAELGPDFQFMQYIFVRMSEMRQLHVPSKSITLIELARKLRQQKIPPKIKVDLSGTASLLSSFLNEVVTIYQENLYPNSCNIGRVIQVTKHTFSLLEITTEAEWESEPTLYRLNQITRVDLPDPYVKTLLLINESRRRRTRKKP